VNSALSARTPNAKGNGAPSSSSSSTPQSNPDAVCYNCDCKGHYKNDCWRPGGGKEGQGPNQHGRRGRCPQKQSANTAKESDGQETNYAFIMTDLVSIAQGMGIPPECCGAIVDSGATSHFCPDRTKFMNFVTIAPQDIYTANRSALSATGKGEDQCDTKGCTVCPLHGFYTDLDKPNRLGQNGGAF
jgi:hypothetical protein